MPGGVHEFMKAWEPEEDQIIMEMLERLGPKWSKIVQRLPGRTVSSVRNRWQRIDKGRRLREAGHESKNRCQQCGKPKRGHVCMARLKNRGESGELAAIALKQWEVANHVVTGGPVKGGEGGGGEGGVGEPLVSRSMSAPAYLEGNTERPVGRDYDRGQVSMENAVRSGPSAPSSHTIPQDAPRPFTQSHAVLPCPHRHRRSSRSCPPA